MKKLLTLVALLAVFMGAKADTIVDAEVDFSTVTEIPRFGWGGSESAFARLSLQDGCLHFHSTEATDPTWDCQWFPIGGVDAEVGVTYTLHYKVKGDHNENISMLGFGQTPYGQFPITTEWVEGSIDYVCSSADGNMLCQAGGYVGDFDIAYLKITHEGTVEVPPTWVELLTNGDAEKSWESLGLADVSNTDNDNNYKVCIWAKERDNHLTEDGGFATFPAHIIAEPGNESNHIFWIETPAATTEGDPAAWDSQIWFESPRQWKTGEQFKLSFRYKADTNVVTNTQVHHQDPGNYLYWQAIGDINFKDEWQTFEQIVTVPADANGMWSIAFNLNPNNKDPMNFYIDDLSWSEMELQHGLFVTAKNTESGLVEYNFAAATEFVYNDEVGAYEATVGKVGDHDSWVNEVMISTVRGNDRQYKANTLKPDVAEITDPFSEESWGAYKEAASAKVALPAQGVWTIYIDTDANQMAFLKLEGDASREKDVIVENPNEIVIQTVEREMTQAEGQAAGYAEGSEELAACTGQPWDNQFFLIGKRDLAVGEEVYISFDYMATTPTTVATQNSRDAGNYLHWAGLGELSFTEEWQHFEKTVTIPAETEANGPQNSWTFNLANDRAANEFHFKNIIFCNAEKDETFIDMVNENPANFQKKVGANTAPQPTGITEIKANNVNSRVIYNLAGQRVANSYKGIAIKNGRKFIMK